MKSIDVQGAFAGLTVAVAAGLSGGCVIDLDSGDDGLSLDVLSVSTDEIVIRDLADTLFFVLRDNDGRRLYTHRGEFPVENNKVVTAGGMFVQGFPVDERFNLQTYRIQDLTIPLGSQTINEPTSRVEFDGVLSTKDTAVGGSVVERITVYADDGAAVALDVIFELTAFSATQAVWTMTTQTPNGATVVGTEIFTFDGNGDFLSSPLFDADVSGQTIRLDFSRVDGDRTLASDLTVSSQDGFPLGTLTSFDVGSDGRIIGTFDNNQQRTVGQFIVALISNPETLVSEGSDVFSTGAATNNPVILTPEP